MFRKIYDNVLEGECPYCESLSFKFKEKDTWMFLCHSCQRYFPFAKLNIVEKELTVEARYNNLLTLCVPVGDLPDEHKAKRYCVSRKIPLALVYYIEDFSKFAKYSDINLRREERLVIPFFDENGDMFGLQGRSLGGSSLRYITVMFDKDKPKIYGLDRLDKTKDYFVVEGPIDSMFIDNCVAMAGSDGKDEDGIMCFDNEPYSKVIINKMKSIIDNGRRIVIWPSNIVQKDVNDAYLAGYDVNTILRENVYQGLDALMRLNLWKKC